jgi:hypothetical protein
MSEPVFPVVLAVIEGREFRPGEYCRRVGKIEASAFQRLLAFLIIEFDIHRWSSIAPAQVP